MTGLYFNDLEFDLKQYFQGHFIITFLGMRKNETSYVKLEQY